MHGSLLQQQGVPIKEGKQITSKWHPAPLSVSDKPATWIELEGNFHNNRLGLKGFTPEIPHFSG